MAEAIEIVIRKNQEGALTNSGSEKVVSSNEKGGTKNTIVNSILVSMGKQIATQTLSVYGKATGNTLVNQKIENALNIANMAIQITQFGWVGVGMVAFEVATDVINKSVSVTNANREADYLLARTGNTRLDGGRGTND